MRGIVPRRRRATALPTPPCGTAHRTLINDRIARFPIQRLTSLKSSCAAMPGRAMVAAFFCTL